jgi:hypothetical protein
MIQTTLDNIQAMAHDDNALAKAHKLRNGVLYKWPCGCSQMIYNPNRRGMQSIKTKFCAVAGNYSKAKKLMPGGSSHNRKQG